MRILRSRSGSATRRISGMRFDAGRAKRLTIFAGRLLVPLMANRRTQGGSRRPVLANSDPRLGRFEP